MHEKEFLKRYPITNNYVKRLMEHEGEIITLNGVELELSINFNMSGWLVELTNKEWLILATPNYDGCGYVPIEIYDNSGKLTKDYFSKKLPNNFEEFKEILREEIKLDLKSK